MVFVKEFFEKVYFKQCQQTTKKNIKNYPACKELNVMCFGGCKWVFLSCIIFKIWEKFF